jgi:hypothetical protein
VAPAADTFPVVHELLTGWWMGILFALPWVAATVWVGWRAGWRVLWSENGREFPTQASRLRGFGPR